MASATEISPPEKINSFFGRGKDLEVGGNQHQEPTGFLMFMPSRKFFKKVGAEFIGTFFLIFIGVGSVVIDKKTDGSVTHLGVALVWGMVVMVLVYALGHISGAHFNPAVTLAFATVRTFPLINIPGYIGAQVLGSITGVYILRLMFGDTGTATVPTGSETQSFFLEMIITFLLMFVVSAVATDSKAVGELAGLAVGTTVAMNVAVAASISGSSMNPARTIGSAVVDNESRGIWVYMVGPLLGAIAGAWAYDFIRLSDRPVREITKSGSFLNNLRYSSSLRN